jgi:peptidoglycan/LPS O-acetylase OafA/YrhL
LQERVGARDDHLDLLRGVALCRVVAYHALGIGWLTVAFPSMGVMFALAGSLMAASLNRVGTRAVVLRARRLLPPLWALAIVAIPLMTVAGWRTAANRAELLRLYWWIIPLADPWTNRWGFRFAAVLWYLRTYLWFVLASPLLRRAYRRWPRGSMAAPLALLLVLTAAGARTSAFVDFVTYLPCWLLGFAHRDGRLLRMSSRRLTCCVTAFMVAGGTWIVLHDATRSFDLGFNADPVGNALWSPAFVLVALRLRPAPDRLWRHRLVSRLIGALNARAVTIYLWHYSLVAVAGWALAAWSFGTHGALTACLRLALTTILTGLAVLLLGWVEDVAARRRPRLVHNCTAHATPSPQRPSAIGYRTGTRPGSPPDRAELPQQRHEETAFESCSLPAESKTNSPAASDACP